MLRKYFLSSAKLFTEMSSDIHFINPTNPVFGFRKQQTKYLARKCLHFFINNYGALTSSKLKSHLPLNINKFNQLYTVQNHPNSITQEKYYLTFS